MADQLAPGQLSDDDIKLLHQAAVAKQQALMQGPAKLTQANVSGDDAAALGMGRGDLSAGLGTSAADADAYLDRLAQDAALRKATGATGSQAPANPMQAAKDPVSGQPVPSTNVIPGKSANPAPSGAANQAPASAPPPVGGKLGPGVQMDPNVTIKVGPSSSMLEPKGPSGSDMPDPHAPEPQDEEPDEDDDDGDLPFRFGRG